METKRIDKQMALKSWASGRSNPNVSRFENQVFNGKLEKPKRERLRAKDMDGLINESVSRQVKVCLKTAKRYPDISEKKKEMISQLTEVVAKKPSPKELREERRLKVKLSR